MRSLEEPGFQPQRAELAGQNVCRSLRAVALNVLAGVSRQGGSCTFSPPISAKERAALVSRRPQVDEFGRSVIGVSFDCFVADCAVVEFQPEEWNGTLVRENGERPVEFGDAPFRVPPTVYGRTPKKPR